MLKIILFLPFLHLSYAVCAQPSVPKSATDCEVIASKGVVQLAKNHHLLKTGSRFGRNDSLIFQQTSHFLVVMDRKRQSFLVKPKNDRSPQTALWTEMPTVVNNRAGKILSYVAFRQFLTGRKWLVLGGSVSLQLGKETFPLDDTHFFYTRYRWAGDTAPVNKRLPQQLQEIQFSRIDLFKIDGKPISPETVSDFTLFYYDDAQKKSIEIGQFDLVFPDDVRLREEIGVLRARYADTPDEQEALRKAVLAYLTEVYGVPEMENFEEWWKG